MIVPKLRFPEFNGEWEEKNFYEVFDILQNNNSQIDTEIIERSKKYTKNYELIENFDKLPEEIKKTLNKLIKEISMQKCVD